jgi:hypothetical protein
MKKVKNTPRLQQDDVDRAIATAQRGVAALVRLIAHPDQSLGLKAALTVGNVRELPVRPLTAALGQAAPPHQHAVMLALLREIGPPLDLELLAVLSRISASNPIEPIKVLIEDILEKMTDGLPLRQAKNEKPPGVWNATGPT